MLSNQAVALIVNTFILILVSACIVFLVVGLIRNKGL